MPCPNLEGAMVKKWTWVFFAILILWIAAFPQLGFSKDPVRVYFFYSDESGGLKSQDELITPLSKKYPIEVKSF